MAAKYLLAFDCQLSFVNSLVTETGDGEIARCSIFDAEIKLEALETSWNKLADANEKITGCRDIDQTHAYFKEGKYSKALQRYITVKSALKRCINELEPRPTPLSPHNLTVNASMQHRPQLPVIQPPKFNGEFLEWQSFKNKFLSVVNKDGINEVDKMHYIINSVHGTAYLLIANLEITETSFADAWATLTTRYENKRVLITAQLNKLCSIQKMASRSAKEINTILNIVGEVLNALRCLGSPIEQWDQLLVHFITQKLDSQTREDWEINLGSATDYPFLDRLKNFLLARARALETMEGNLPKPRGAKPNKNSSIGSKPVQGSKELSSRSVPFCLKQRNSLIFWA